MSRASGKLKGFSSVEALFSLLAAGALAAAVAMDVERTPADETIARVNEFKMLEGFLDVREHVPLTGEFVAASGYCLSVSSLGARDVLPANCTPCASEDVVSTARISFGNGRPVKITASLWKP